MPTKIPLVPPRVQALIPFIGRSMHPAPFKKFTKAQGRHACELQTLGGGKFLYRGVFKSPFWEGPPCRWNLDGFGCYWAIGRFVYDEDIGGRKVLNTQEIYMIRVLTTAKEPSEDDLRHMLRPREPGIRKKIMNPR